MFINNSIEPSSPFIQDQGWTGPPTQVLSSQRLKELNHKSNLKGLLQLLGHLTVILVSGTTWALLGSHSPFAWIALVIYGISLATMFAALHECIHRTAFASNRLNDSAAWLAGLLSFYNSTFYRYYHRWHHQYTQIPGKDPELNDPKPTSVLGYLKELSGLPWWWGKLRGHTRIALGNLEDCPFVPESAHGRVIRSTRLQLAVYGLLIAASFAVSHPWFLLLWVLPLAVGQPFLRFILLAEHTGCQQDDNPFTNTRTTLTLWPVRCLMWNMPYHTEHHLYPSLPFHALASAHQELQPYLAYVVPGYLYVNRQILASFHHSEPVT
ncbi:MAG: fatty acid desaturase family protein [Synechococcaceae cyanobacterium SM2_3_1]|nr:fatty acid desaturase family protein [Synechococcaceae cyanobacterium SM2_3_1]